MIQLEIKKELLIWHRKRSLICCSIRAFDGVAWLRQRLDVESTLRNYIKRLTAASIILVFKSQFFLFCVTLRQHIPVNNKKPFAIPIPFVKWNQENFAFQIWKFALVELKMRENLFKSEDFSWINLMQEQLEFEVVVQTQRREKKSWTVWLSRVLKNKEHSRSFVT